MAKYVMYIIDLEDGGVYGTNSVEEAEQFIEDDNFIVLHQGGAWFQGGRDENETQPISEHPNFVAEEEEDEDD